MGYRKDYKTRIKDPDALREEPAKGQRSTPASPPRPDEKLPTPPAPPTPSSLPPEQLDDRLMALAGGEAEPEAAPDHGPDKGPDLPPDPADLVSHLPLEHYQASGKYTTGGAVVTVLLGGLFAGIFGAIYGWATAHVSVTLLNFPICLCYGFIAAIAVYLAAQAGKLRSDGAIFVASFIVCVFAWFASWVVFNVVMANREVVPYNPTTLDGMLGNVLALSSAGRGLFGSWVRYGQGVTIATWIMEGLFMVFFPPLLNISIVSSTPFCEDCGKWVDAESYTFKIGPAPDLEEFRKDVIRRGPAAIAAMGPPTLESFIEVRVCVCPLCQKVGFMNTASRVRRGMKRPDTTSIDSNLVLRGLELRRMQELVDAARAAGQDVIPDPRTA